MSTIRLLNIIQLHRPHQGYERSVELAKQAKLIMAEVSEDQRELIEHIRKSESAQELEQRLRLSTPVTGAALIGPISYQSRIARAPDRLEFFYSNDKSVQANIQRNFERFYAGYTLYEFAFNQVCFANNYDPNAILLFEQDQEEGEYSRLYPVFISSEQAWHLEYDRYGELQELAFIRKKAGFSKAQHEGLYAHWYFYSAETAAEAIEINEYTPAIEEEGYSIETVIVNNEVKRFYVRGYEMNLGFVPAIQLGAYRDYQSPLFQGKALFYQGALPILHKFANIGTMMDVMDTTSAFPERFRYVPDCDYQNEQGDICERGTLTSGEKCPSCKGTGKKYAMTEQRSIEFAFEPGMNAEDIIELAKLAYDHRPPTESLNYLNDKLNSFFRMVQALIFNQDLTQAISMKTATEVNAAVDAITNHLMPMASALEAVWEMGHKCALAYNAIPPEKAEYSCKHPDDFQVSSTTQVINDLKETIEAGASNEAVTAMQRKLLLRAYPNDTNYVDSCIAFQSYLPFQSLPSAQQFAIITSLPANHPDRVLTERAGYIQNRIFQELQTKGLYFTEIDAVAQRSMIEAEVEKVIEGQVMPFLPGPAPDAPILD